MPADSDSDVFDQTPDSSSLSESGDWDSYSLARLDTTRYIRISGKVIFCSYTSLWVSPKKTDKQCNMVGYDSWKKKTKQTKTLIRPCSKQHRGYHQ